MNQEQYQEISLLHVTSEQNENSNVIVERMKAIANIPQMGILFSDAVHIPTELHFLAKDDLKRAEFDKKTADQRKNSGLCISQLPNLKSVFVGVQYNDNYSPTERVNSVKKAISDTGLSVSNNRYK